MVDIVSFQATIRTHGRTHVLFISRERFGNKLKVRKIYESSIETLKAELFCNLSLQERSNFFSRRV